MNNYKMNTRKSIALAQERTREKRQLVGKYSRKEKHLGWEMKNGQICMKQRLNNWLKKMAPLWS